MDEAMRNRLVDLASQATQQGQQIQPLVPRIIEGLEAGRRERLREYYKALAVRAQELRRNLGEDEVLKVWYDHSPTYSVDVMEITTLTASINIIGYDSQGSKAEIMLPVEGVAFRFQVLKVTPEEKADLAAKRQEFGFSK